MKPFFGKGGVFLMVLFIKLVLALLFKMRLSFAGI